METSMEKSKEVKTIKLPKLAITKFSGKFSDWLPFWNTFEAEIDSFSYPEPVLRAARQGALAKSITGYHENMVIEYIRY
jgi:hypothetical protein